MQELDYDHRVFDTSNVNGPMPGDEKLLVRFYMGYVEDPIASAESGRPIYRDEEFIKIVTPGDRNNIVDRPIRPMDKVRFANQYNHYKLHGTTAVVGTVLDEWPLVSKAMCETLKAAGFHTVEQVAEARDDIVQTIPGMTTLKQRAQNFLDLSKGNAPITKLEEQLAAEKSSNDALRNQVAELNKKVQELLDAKPKAAAK